MYLTERHTFKTSIKQKMIEKLTILQHEILLNLYSGGKIDQNDDIEIHNCIILSNIGFLKETDDLIKFKLTEKAFEYLEPF